MIELHHGDCLEVMQQIPAGSVDAVICDPPYGTTQSKWDAVIPFEPMWEHLDRILKPRGATILFSAQPFTSALIMSNPEWFKWDDVWDKKMPVGHLNAKKMPLRRHESICMFSSDTIGTYNPQMRKGKMRLKGSGRTDGNKGCYGAYEAAPSINDTYYPTSIIEASNAVQGDKQHPNQKPVEIMEYLAKTYTNPGDTVLDFTMGSGTTGVACANLGRRFIGIEKDAGYFAIAERRIAQAQEKARMNLFAA